MIFLKGFRRLDEICPAIISRNYNINRKSIAEGIEFYSEIYINPNFTKHFSNGHSRDFTPSNTEEENSIILSYSLHFVVYSK